MENEKLKEQQPVDDIELTRVYIGYPDKYVIIEDKETLKSYIKHKVKKAWINENDKFCLESFILFAFDNKDPNKYIYIPLIKGKAQQKKKEEEWPKENFDNLFKKGNLVFCGYLEDDKVRDEINARIQGIY